MLPAAVTQFSQKSKEIPYCCIETNLVLAAVSNNSSGGSLRDEHSGNLNCMYIQNSVAHCKMDMVVSSTTRWWWLPVRQDIVAILIRTDG